MDPVSIFEDALKGLATKDSDDKLEPPRSTIQSVIPESTKTENSTTPQKRSPLVTTSLLVNSPAHAQPPTKVAEDTGGDIILNALINAGITPSSLNAPTDTSPAPIKHVQKPLSTAVKVVSAKGPTVYKIVRNPISAVNTLSPSQHPLGIANSVVGPFKLDRENFVTSSIRKRPAADILTRPDAKIWRPANGLPFIDPTAARHQSVMLSSTPSVPSRLNGWAGHIKTQRFGGPTNFLGSPMNFVKPYQFLKRDEDMDDDEGLTQAETYADYVPLKLRIGHRHPDPVVESSSLSSVSPPDIHYQHCLPNETIEMGCLSSLQLEAVIYACQRHECILPNGQRAGFLIGDGAGVGKGRTIAGIIYENYLRHRKKAIWLSVSNDLKVDAERDLRDVGLFKVNVHSLSKFKYARISGKENGRVKKGIIFSTYSSLIGESQGGAKAKYKTRLKQLVHWCGKNFDGVIVFDECHRAKNLTPSGSQKPTKTGLTVLELQNRLPHARIVYASATGATEPRNMGYMTRLGLWGEGTPFKTFNSFIQTLERRGVGAMELVAMDMKLRGMYIARQLSFKGVHFGIREVSIEDVKLKNENFIDVYNQCTDLWVYAYRFFSEATRLLCPGDRYRKTMWGQFWSSHQRFFKYLCIAAKLDACVELTKAALKDGHCVVIGLQSTGEAKTLEQVEEFGCDLGDFVSTTKGVFQSLIEKYFPTTSNLEAFSQRGDRLASAGDRTSSLTLSRAGRAIAAGQGSGLGLKDVLGEKMFARLVAGGSLSGSTDADAYTDSKLSKGLTDSDDGGDGPSEDSEDEESDSESKANEKERSTSSDYYDSDLELNSASNSARKRRQKKKTPANRAQTSTSRRKQQQQQANSSSDEFLSNSDDDWDPDAMFDSFLARQNMWTRENSELRKKAGTTSLLDNFSNEDSTRELSQKYLLRRNCLKDASSVSQASVSPDEAKRQCHEMQTLLLKFIEKLGSKLPPSSLDELIDKLGGPSCVAEMTGRKGRMVMNGDGRVTYESRREFDVNLEILNLTEKQRFMDGDKLIAIISEAASSGISLQADRRASNQRRRVHITLELPWSADRAIQQFGRTHRSNQVSAPKYVFLISDLAGEQRFASTVAKRLESLGALTHGDRRATDTRDLSQFNIDNKLGREALDIVMRSCTTGDEGIVDPPMDYTSTEMDDEEKSSVMDKAHRFFVDVKASLQGVGLATGHARDRESNQMSKFLNRILGMRVHVQNALFRYFSDTLEELIRRAKRDNRLDLGIMDLGTSGQNVDITWTKSFDTWFLSESTKVHLHKITSERGLSWASAMEIYSQHDGSNDGFYLPSNVSSGRLVLPILAVYVKSRPAARLSGGKVDTKYYRIYRPNTGMQARPLELEKLKERYTRVSNPSDCQDAWQRVFKDSATRCSHVMQHGVCPRAVNNRVVCEVGLRVRTYYVLSGSVLNVWAQIEPLLQSQSNGSRCMQVVRLRSKDGQRIIGSLIPQECVEGILNCLSNPVDTSTSAGAIPSTFTGRIGYVPHVGRLAHPKSEAVLSSADRQWPRRTPDSNAFNTNPSSPRRFSHYSRSPRVQSFHRPFSQRPSILQRSTTPGNRNLSSPFSSPIRSTLPRSASFSSVGMFLPSADPAKSDSTDFGLPQNRFGSRLNAALSSNGTSSFSSPLSQVRESVLSSTKSFLNASSSVMSTSSNAATSSTTAPSVSKKQPVKATKFKIRWKEG